MTSAGRVPLHAELTVRADLPGDRLDPNLQGQFAEHLGRGVYDGPVGGRGFADPECPRAAA